jgi:ketosteroid isomerase-like protein
MVRLGKLGCLGILLCALPFALPAHRAEAGSVHRVHRKQYRGQIADLEQQWRKATLNADVAAIDRMLSDDYVGISWNGQVNTKTSHLDRLRSRTLMLTRLDLSDFKIKIVDSVAIVTSRADIDGINDGVEMTGSFVYTRIYKRLSSGVWKITNFEATRLPTPGHIPHKQHIADAGTR